MKRYVMLVMAMCGLAIADVNLTDDIEKFVALFPTDNTVNLKSYEKTKAAIEYMESRDLECLTNLPEFEAIKNFVEDAGLDPSMAINAVSRISGLSNLAIAWRSPGKSSKVIISGGFEGSFGDISPVFPTESVAALDEKKLISSKVFSSFLEKIASQEFRGCLTALRATEKYRELLFKLLSPRADSVDLDNPLATDIGLKSDRAVYKAPRPIDSLHDFIKPGSKIDDVAELSEKYQRMTRPLSSNELTELFESLRRSEEGLVLEKSLREAGIDMKSLYHKFYQTFVQQRSSSGYSEADTNVAIAEKVREFFDNIRNRRSLEETKDFREKRSGSAASDTRTGRTQSDRLLALRDALKARELSRKIKEAVVSLKDSGNDYASLFSKLIGVLGKASN